MFGAILNIITGFSYGNIASFVQYSRKFSGPINETANIITDLLSALAAAERVFALLDEPKEDKNENGEMATISNGTVTFDHVKFSYIEGKTIIHDFSLKVNKGDMVAIVGPTGAGKTTIINLLLKFYDLDEGTIYLNGVDISKMKLKEVRKNFSLVLQDAWLMDASIYENLIFGNPNATKEEVIEAAKLAYIHDYIESLPNGYDTLLKQGGSNISKGQKQLLTIARAMLTNSNILILDEATSNVDTRTEAKIQEAMKNLMKNKTCFTIAHRLSTIENADTIIVLKDGDIIEQGNHKALLEKEGGFYQNLFKSQFK